MEIDDKINGSANNGNGENDLQTLQVQLISDTGEETGPPIDLPVTVTVEQLGLICNALLENEEQRQYLFYVDDKEITKSLDLSLTWQKTDTENVLHVVYQPQSLFRVRPVTRCTSSIPGHSEAVVSLCFSPNSLQLASGSGDTTVRLWDLNTETPHYTCTGHRQWVLCVAWSPDGKKLASACKAGDIIIWNPETGKQCGRTMRGHKKWINCLSWEPFHVNPECRRMASASADGDCRIWDVVLGQCSLVIAGKLGIIFFYIRL